MNVFAKESRMRRLVETVTWGLSVTMSLAVLLAMFLAKSPAALAQDAPTRGAAAAPATAPDLATQVRQLSQAQRGQGQEMDVVQKQVDDVMWHLRLGDIAEVDKVTIASSKPVRMQNPTGQGADNPLLIYAYTFTPKKLAEKQKAPLLLVVHGGIHANFDTGYYTHIVRELVMQGYIVAAPEYRGSTGYGGEFYSQIDYGGAEIDDTHDVRNWAVANLAHVDAERVGIMGWSHGGYHTLMNIFRWPKDYKVAYAGCPVSDLVMRMGYKSQSYRDTFAAFTGGKQADENPMEYRRRSPYFHAAELQTPLLIHSTTNDEDVNVMEVEHLIDALKAAGKQFEYKIYENAPGGHHFNRIDTALARESRQEIYSFLARQLKP
jgi:dipeptidyl aminopeptidase/acylaminoacyl peptidase